MAERRDIDEVDQGEVHRLGQAAAGPSSSLARAFEAAGRAVVGCAAPDLPRLAAARVAEADPLQGAGLWLLDPAGDRLRLRGWAGRLETPAAEWPDVDLRGSALGAIARAPQPSQVSGHTVATEVLPAVAAALEQSTFIGFPLVRGDDLHGVLGLFGERRLLDVELALGTLLARDISAEIAIGRLRQEASVQARPDLIALLGHELRTPLTALRGNVQLAGISVQKGDYRRVGDRLAVSLRLVDALTALLQNLQDMSRIQQGIFALSFAPDELTSTVQSAIRRVERTIDTGRHVIALQTTEPLVIVHDARQLEQVVYHLIVNALTYSPEGGTVVVRVERDDAGGGRVAVADEGIGIAPEEQERIFEPYYRSRRAREASAKGLGLGLAICRTVVAHHGGSILVESRPAAGSTFTVLLPAVPPAQG